MARLTEIARESTMAPGARLLAIQSQQNLGATGEALALLEEIAGDALIDDEHRERAVEAICRFGGIAPQVFSSPVYDAHAPLDLGIATGGVDHREKGLVYLERENYAEAIASLDAALGGNPKDAWAYCYRGEAYFALGNYEKAIQDLTRAIALNPTIEQAYLRRAAAYKLLGNERAALADYDRAYALNPNGRASLDGSMLALRQKRIGEARKPPSSLDQDRSTSQQQDFATDWEDGYSPEEISFAVAALNRLGFADVLADHLATLAANEEVPFAVRRDAIRGLERLGGQDLLRNFADPS